jgi:uncharacterized membrane-anchored protein YjiN (DUF445 family)
MGEYSKEYGKVNKRIQNDPRENAKIEKLRQQWMNTGAPQALRRKWVTSSGQMIAHVN